MALQKGTVNGMVCVVDSAAPTVAVRDVTGDLGDVICETAFQLSRKRVAFKSLDLMSANTGTAMFPASVGCTGILNGSATTPFSSNTNIAGFQANGLFDGASASLGGHGCSANGLTSGYGTMIAVNHGSMCRGYATSYGQLQAYGEGSVALGLASSYGVVNANSAGAFASGYAIYGSITASGIGSHAHGQSSAAGAGLIASGVGSLAAGLVVSGSYSIEASGNASVALGVPTTGQSIIASGEAAVQIGNGTNAIPNSIALKGTIRMKPDGTGTLRNGDFWYDTATHKFKGRANGTTVDFH